MNLVQDKISLPEKSDSFQGLPFDLLLICAKHLASSLHVIVPTALPINVALLDKGLLEE
jgi:hypothetical protein